MLMPNYYILPDDPEPLADDPLADGLQAAIAGISGLPGKLVRPRWQPQPPPQPPVATTWAALGVTEQVPDANGYIKHNGLSAGGLGDSYLQRHESLTVLVSFYGPQCQRFAERLGQGLLIESNREGLDALGIKLHSIGALRHVPELINDQWLRRVDVEIRFRRQLNYVYSVRNIVAADIYLENDAAQPATTIIPITE
jgi:hypothetical protein